MRFEVKQIFGAARSDAGKWRWRIVDDEGRPLATSPYLDNEHDCRNAIELVQRELARAETVTIDDNV